MPTRLSLILATLALSAVAFAQPQDLRNQVGYFANLNIGDSELNLSNDGAQGGFLGATPVASEGNICVNVYAFDPAEEEIACCACLVTPNGLNSLSVTSDLTSNPLTPAIPTSITVYMIASEPALDQTGNFRICNPVLAPGGPAASVPYYAAPVPAPGPTDTNAGFTVLNGMLAWGTTLEPASTPGTFSPVDVNFIGFSVAGPEYDSIVNTCSFIQGDGSGFGICKSCRTGGLGGAKK